MKTKVYYHYRENSDNIDNNQDSPFNIHSSAEITKSEPENLSADGLFLNKKRPKKIFVDGLRRVNQTKQYPLKTKKHQKRINLITSQKKEARIITNQPQDKKEKVFQKTPYFGIKRFFTKKISERKHQKKSSSNTKKEIISLQRLFTQKRKYAHSNKLNNYSFLNLKIITLNFAIILLMAGSLTIYVKYRSNQKITAALLAKQQEIIEKENNADDQITVLGAVDKKNNSSEDENNIDKIVFQTLTKFEKIRREKLEAKIKEMVAGTPMEQMAPYIAQRDKIVAAFLVGIAKKESNYGRRVPILNGKDCYNYWGYRGIRKKMGTGGHTCFDSPEDAVKTVGNRIERLVKSGIDTPQEMVLWKCGSACHKDAMAKKWISDVNLFYSKMIEKIEEEPTNNENGEENDLLKS